MKVTINRGHWISQSEVNKNWFVYLDGKIIAGFHDEEDAKLFAEIKKGCSHCGKLSVYYCCQNCGTQFVDFAFEKNIT
jgi:hypothetical protein